MRDTLIAAGSAALQGPFVRPPSEFNAPVQVAGTSGGGKHVASAGRFHLFVSGVCPWATGTRMARLLMGLEEVVGTDVADGYDII